MEPQLTSYILVTGLPASGKSTLANQLQDKLDWPMMDKDTILEAMNVTSRATSAEQRRQISSTADQIFVALAKQLGCGILCTFWNHPASTTTPGTDALWLRTHSSRVIEIYCHCPAETSYERIQIRQQKQGASEANRTNLGYDLLSEYKAEASLGPLNLGQLITVKTDQPVKIEPLISQIQTLLTNPQQ